MKKTYDLSLVPEKARLSMEPYQIKCLDFILQHPKCGVFLDIGYGKTLTALTAAAVLKCRNVLVIAPKAIARTTWQAEVEKWNFPFRCISLVEQPDEKTGKLKILPLKTLPPIYETMLKREPGDAPVRLFITSRDRIVHLDSWCRQRGARPFDMILCDEFQSFKSGRAERTKAVMNLASGCPRLVGLTGTPMPSSLEDIWSEIRILDGGRRLGKYITQFRDRYEVSAMVINGHAVGWKPREGAMDQVFRKIGDITISVKTDLHLPALKVRDVPVVLPPEAMDLYRTFMKEKILTLDPDTDITPANAAVLAAKLLQIASGFVYDEAKGVHLIHDAKIQTAQHIIDGTGGNVIVAYGFRADRERLLNSLDPGPGQKIAAFDGSRAMQDAWNRGEYRILLFQPASTCHGINLQQGGSAMIWYTLPWSLEHYQQTIGRLYRKGQTKPVIIHRLIAENTFDQRVASLLERKGDGNESLLAAVRQEIRTMQTQTE